MRAYSVADTSLLPDGLDGNRRNHEVSRIHVGVASGDGTKSEEVAVAEMLGHPIEPPPGESHVGSGKPDKELLWRRSLAVVVIGPESVVEHLALDSIPGREHGRTKMNQRTTNRYGME